MKSRGEILNTIHRRFRHRSRCVDTSTFNWTITLKPGPNVLDQVRVVNQVYSYNEDRHQSRLQNKRSDREQIQVFNPDQNVGNKYAHLFLQGSDPLILTTFGPSCVVYCRDPLRRSCLIMFPRNITDLRHNKSVELLVI